MTSDFDPKNREQYASKMNLAGYQELDFMRGFESYNNFCCLNCVYFKRKDNSPTGWWCEEFGFPDRRFACCDGFKALPR